jgi:hypothetical protein
MEAITKEDLTFILETYPSLLSGLLCFYRKAYVDPVIAEGVESIALACVKLIPSTCDVFMELVPKAVGVVMAKHPRSYHPVTSLFFLMKMCTGNRAVADVLIGSAGFVCQLLSLLTHERTVLCESAVGVLYHILHMAPDSVTTRDLVFDNGGLPLLVSAVAKCIHSWYLPLALAILQKLLVHRMDAVGVLYHGNHYKVAVDLICNKYKNAALSECLLRVLTVMCDSVPAAVAALKSDDKMGTVLVRLAHPGNSSVPGRTRASALLTRFGRKITAADFEAATSTYYPLLKERVDCQICCSEEDDEECEPGDVVTLPCNHRYHLVCIGTWLHLGKENCPLCRGSVSVLPK